MGERGSAERGGTDVLFERRGFATWLLGLVVMVAVAACGPGSAGGASLAPDPTEDAPGTASGPFADPPDDPCLLLTKTDVQQLFGGEVEPAETEDDDDESTCAFTVTDGKGVMVDYTVCCQPVSITFDNGYISYEEEHKAFGDDVQEVKGLGAEAWRGLGAIHIDFGGGDQLIVTAMFGGAYDPTVITAEQYALAKLVLSRLRPS